MLPFAVRTGLEPATPGVTGRYSNQLNYRTILVLFPFGIANIGSIFVSANFFFVLFKKSEVDIAIFLLFFESGVRFEVVTAWMFQY